MSLNVPSSSNRVIHFQNCDEGKLRVRTALRNGGSPNAIVVAAVYPVNKQSSEALLVSSDCSNPS